MKTPTRKQPHSAPFQPARPIAAPAASQSVYSYVRIERRGPVTIVRFTGRALLDEDAIRAIGDELIRLIDKFGNKHLVLDFGEVRNLSSYMLATLVKVHRRVQEVGGKLVLCDIDPELTKVFKLTNLDRLFALVASEREALKSF
jgi:stage II sporulation protein AA (anti-sigma F factor antagonist)